MEGMAQALDTLLKQGILPAAFIIGSIAFFISLIGKIPVGDGHDIPPFPRFFLGLFGFIFALAGIGGALFGIFAVIVYKVTMDSILQGFLKWSQRLDLLLCFLVCNIAKPYYAEI